MTGHWASLLFAPRLNVDARTTAKVTHGAYAQEGTRLYDRGHMTPNYAIAGRYGNAAQVRQDVEDSLLVGAWTDNCPPGPWPPA